MNLKISNNIVYQNDLDIDSFSSMLDDPTQCYKFYWLDAILTLVKRGNKEIKFDDIVNEMIVGAWYSVSKYHLKLGPTVLGKCENYLEHAIHILLDSCDINEKMNLENIRIIVEKSDEILKVDKINIIKNVPYRLLAPFLKKYIKEKDFNGGKKALIDKINSINNKVLLPYTIIYDNGYNKKIILNEEWIRFINDNFDILKNWIQLKKIFFLQKRNPGVPGIIYKLGDESEKRRLGKARDLWKLYSEIKKEPLMDIYTEDYLIDNQFDLDHFIPWTYIANDELWNLTPMTKSLNCSKSNNLPDWDTYFFRMAKNQFSLYELIFNNEIMHKQFELCKNDNLNSIWAQETLFIPGYKKDEFIHVLEKNMKPIYNNAYSIGFRVWKVK